MPVGLFSLATMTLARRHRVPNSCATFFAPTGNRFPVERRPPIQANSRRPSRSQALVDGTGPRRQIIDGNYRMATADEPGYACPEIAQEGLTAVDRQGQPERYNTPSWGPEPGFLRRRRPAPSRTGEERGKPCVEENVP
jgi:hypothetical protein